MSNTYPLTLDKNAYSVYNKRVMSICTCDMVQISMMTKILPNSRRLISCQKSNKAAKYSKHITVKGNNHG